MKTINHVFKLSTLSAALLTAWAPAIAADDVAQLTQPDSFISAGIGAWSKDRPQWGIYDGMHEGKAYGLFDFGINRRNNATGTWLTFSGSNLGLDTRELSAEWYRQGDIGASISYSRIPRVNPYTFNTGVQGLGTTFQTIPGTSIVPGTGFNAKPATERDLVELGFYKNIMKGLNFKVSFKNEEKNGMRNWGRGGAPEFVAEPIDWTTRQLEAALEWTGERLQLSGGYYGSWFENANGLVRTECPPPCAAGNRTFWLSLPLDNQAHQLFFNGGYNFTPTTRATVKVQYSRATQDEHLPTTDVPGLSLAGAPTSLDGKVNTTLVQAALTSRPIQGLGLLASFRYYDVDDKTPVNLFVGGGTTVNNTPHSFETMSGKLEANYRLPYQMNVIGGVEVSKQDRSVPTGRFANIAGLTPTFRDTERYVPFRRDLDENTYYLQLRRSLSDTLNGGIGFSHSKRDGSEFTLTNEEPSDEINPVHIADRKRNKWKLSLDWTPMERMGVQFVYEDARDKYGHSGNREYGLRDGRSQLVSLDLNYVLSQDWSANAWYARDKNRLNQFGGRWTRATEEHEADKDARITEEGDNLGIGLRGAFGTAWKLGADVQWSRNESKHQEDVFLTGLCGANGFCTRYPTVAGVPVGAPLPDIESTLTRLSLFAQYALRQNSDLRIDFIHERWRTNDWQWKFADGSPFIYGTTTDGTMVTQPDKQVSNFLGVRYIYKFQ